MLCTLAVAAVTPEGETVAANFIQHWVAAAAPPDRDDRGKTLVLRRPIQAWVQHGWSGPSTSHEEADRTGFCSGRGSGFFEWSFSDDVLRNLGRVQRIRALCEVSSQREGTPQTGTSRHPTSFDLLLNGLRIHQQILPDHPHDSRGALSYLREPKAGRGAYGYLMRASIEGALLQRVIESCTESGDLRFRCAVPENVMPTGGLTVYGYNAGRYPIGPTLIIEWEQT